MPSGIMPARPGEQSHRDRLFSGALADRSTHGSSWIPVALALAGFAAVTAIGLMRNGQLDRGEADKERRSGPLSGAPEVERSITIGKAADELRQRWLDPGTLPDIMAGFATVRAINDGRVHWKVAGPLGRVYEWDSETVDDGRAEDIGWRSLPDASIANEGSIHFSAAPADRGTVATLHLRFGSPGSLLGDAAVEVLGTMPLDVAAERVLRRFKSLVETGEIPTTERQPAARADTR